MKKKKKESKIVILVEIFFNHRGSNYRGSTVLFVRGTAKLWCSVAQSIDYHIWTSSWNDNRGINITWTLRSTAFTFPRYARRSSKFLFTLSSCYKKKKKMKKKIKKKFPTFFHFLIIFSINTGCPIKLNICCKKWCNMIVFTSNGIKRIKLIQTFDK